MKCTYLLVKLFLYVCFLFLYMSDLKIIIVWSIKEELIHVYLIRSNQLAVEDYDSLPPCP